MTAIRLHTNPIKNALAENFLNSVSKMPDNNAIYIQSTYYSYKQLFELVVDIYNKIPSNKIYNKIGIYCSDSVYDYASILAINLYGAAYVPLNNKFTVEKNNTIIKQCGLEIVLVYAETEILGSLNDKVVFLNIKDTTGSANQFSRELIATDFQKIMQPIAYILFTSGSTGEPKGVPVSFENCFYFFDFFYKNYSFNSNDKFLQVYELTFDVSVFSFFMPIQLGACCYVVPNDGVKFMKIAEMLLNHNITVVSMVPSTIMYLKKYFNEINLPNLKYSFFSGDKLIHSVVNEWKKSIPNAVIHNFYGPTETTIVCTRYIWDETNSQKESVNDIVPIGKPFPEMEYIFVDESNEIASKGELCFTGKQVIANYLNNANSDKFISINNKIYYKTGDLASVNSIGDLLFEGRLDNQVKIDGYRVELGEVELSIEKNGANCSVLVSKNKDGREELTAFIVKNDKTEEEWKRLLPNSLPKFMIPSKFIFLDALPLTMNGKVDKIQLLKLVL